MHDLGLLGIMLVSILLIGCRGAGGSGGESDKEPDRSRDKLVLNAKEGTTWRNHVTEVPDPGGSGSLVLVAEKTGKDRLQMTFVNEEGFFLVPGGHKGTVVVRLFVRTERRVQVILVAGKKLKSHYSEAPVENEWFDVEIPLSHISEKIEAGAKINDITVRLRSPDKETPLEKGAEMYLDRIDFRPE